MAPSLALLVFELRNQDVGQSDFLAGACFPILGIRSGIRWVPLVDPRNRLVPWCGLLVQISIRPSKMQVCQFSFEGGTTPNGRRMTASSNFSSLFLALQTCEDCEDVSLKISDGSAPRRVWLLNLLADRYLDSTRDGAAVLYSGSITFGRKTSCDIVLKDRSISLQHGTLSFRVELSPSVDARGGRQYNRGDKLACGLAYTDTSTNGSFEGSSRRLRKNEFSIIEPRAFYYSDSKDGKNAFEVLAPELPSNAGFQGVLSLGKAFPIDPSSGVRPVFAFVAGIVLAMPFHDGSSVRLTTATLRFFEGMSSPALARILSADAAAGSSNTRSLSSMVHVIKTEPGTNDFTHQSVLDLESSSTPLRVTPRRMAPSTAGLELTRLQEEKELQSQQHRRLIDEIKQQKDETIQKLESDVARCQTRIRELETDSAEMVRRRENEQRTAEQKKTELQAELALAKKKTSTLTVQLAALLKEKDEVVAERNRLSEDLESLELKANQTSAQLVNLEARMEETESHMRQKETDFLKSSCEVDMLRASLNKAENELSKSQLAAAEALAAARYDSTRLTSLQKVNEELNSDLVATKNEVRKLSLGLQLLQVQYDTSQSALKSAGKLSVDIANDLSSRLRTLAEALDNPPRTFSSTQAAVMDDSDPEAITQTHGTNALFNENRPNNVRRPTQQTESHAELFI